MNKTSSVVTGSATFTAAALAPMVEWVANNLLKVSMPPQVVLIFAAFLVTGGHWLINIITAEVPVPNSGTAVVFPTTVSRQAGFARISMLLVLTMIASMFMLTGCAGFNQVVAAKEKSAKVAVQTANDNIITGIEDEISDVPIGAVLRHPEFIPIAKATLLPSGETSSASSLFTPMATATTPAAAPSGVTQQQFSDALNALTTQIQTLQKSIQAPAPAAAAPAPTASPAIKMQSKPRAAVPASPVPSFAVQTVLIPAPVKPVLASPTLPLNTPAPAIPQDPCTLPFNDRPVSCLDKKPVPQKSLLSPPATVPSK